MEHRKFLQRLDELVAELTPAQAQKVIAALKQRGDGDEVQRILEQRLGDDPECPHCGSRRIEGWGRERNGLPRSRCLDCQRTFRPARRCPWRSGDVCKARTVTIRDATCLHHLQPIPRAAGSKIALIPNSRRLFRRGACRAASRQFFVFK